MTDHDDATVDPVDQEPTGDAAATEAPAGGASAGEPAWREADQMRTSPAGSEAEPAKEAELVQYEPDPLRANGPDVSVPPSGPLGLLNDVDMEVTVELGRTVMPIRELLALQPGMVVEIDRAAGAPIDVLVNGRLIARGEVVVIDEEFGVRITDIVSQREVA